MAVTLTNTSALTSLERGIASAEAGINVESVEMDFAPEFKEYLMSKTNEKIGFATAPCEVKITISGEVTLATGLMASTFVSANTIANSMAFFGAPTTNPYLDSAKLSRGRAEWKKISLEFSANAGIA